VYCQAYGRWHDSERKIRELNKADPKGEAGLIGITPSGYQQMSVWLQISNRARRADAQDALRVRHVAVCTRARPAAGRAARAAGLDSKGRRGTAKVIGFPAL
jgi:hypothetical protein